MGLTSTPEKTLVFLPAVIATEDEEHAAQRSLEWMAAAQENEEASKGAGGTWRFSRGWRSAYDHQRAQFGSAHAFLLSLLPSELQQESEPAEEYKALIE